MCRHLFETAHHQACSKHFCRYEQFKRRYKLYKVKYVLKIANKKQLKFCSYKKSSTHHHHVLLSGLGGVLGGGHRVPLQGDDGLAVAPVRCVLLKLFANSEASEFHPDFHRFCPFTDLNFSSMLLTVVLVTIVQLPPSSEMVITGVDARAAFLRMKPTPRAFRNSSYFSEETCVYVPVMGAMAIGAALLVSGCAVRWYGCSQPEG